MFAQLLTPVGDSLLLSFFVAAVPVAVVLVMLGVIHRPGWQASLAGLVVAFALATTVWAMPVGIAGAAIANGIVFALWPVMWIVVNALLLYNIAVASGRFDAFRDWVIARLPNDRRVVLVVIGFCFGALLEGVSGFGTPVAITSALLILVGYAPLEALTFTLIFNTAPVAFGALGAPVTVLGQVTALSDVTLGQMIGRQLPIIAVLLPFYVMGVYGGRRSIAAVWPVLLVSGVSFALCQFFASNYLDYRLTDVLSSLGSLVVTIAFVQVWRPAPDPAYAIAKPPVSVAAGRVPGWQGWLPWIIVSVVVILWTHFQIPTLGAFKSAWPGLDKAVSITLYGSKPYGAVYIFQPLAGGGGDRDPARRPSDGSRGALAGEIIARLHRHHLATKPHRHPDRGPDRRPRLSHELFRDDLYAGQGCGVGRPGVSPGLGLSRLARRVPVRERYLRQCAFRESSGGRRQPAWPQPRAHCGHELLRRRNGKDDLAAKHRDRGLGDESEGSGRTGLCPHLRAQHRPDAPARRDRRGAAISGTVDYPQMTGTGSVQPGPVLERQVHGRFHLQRWTDPNLPASLHRLLAEAERNGYAWISDFLGEWAARPITGEGEALFVAFDEADPTAMAVISADPHVADRETGRLRYIYVAQAARQQGLARCLVEACLRQATPHWRRLRLHTDSAIAARLYEAYGFRPVDDENRSTHVKVSLG